MDATTAMLIGLIVGAIVGFLSQFTLALYQRRWAKDSEYKKYKCEELQKIRQVWENMYVIIDDIWRNNWPGDQVDAQVIKNLKEKIPKMSFAGDKEFNVLYEEFISKIEWGEEELSGAVLPEMSKKALNIIRRIDELIDQNHK